MKKCVFALMLLLCAAGLHAQEVKTEVFHLKNGSVVKGAVVGEMGDSIALRGTDGSLFIFAAGDVTKRLLTEEARQAQAATEKLELQTDLLNGARVSRSGERLKERDVKAILASHTQAAQLYRSAMNLNRTVSVMCFASGFILGWELVDVGVFDKKWSTPAVCVAAASFVGAFGVNAIANHRAKKAVELYNASIETPQAKTNDLSLSVGLTSGGIGMTLRF